MHQPSESEFGPYRFPDKRLAKRFQQIIDIFTNNPTASIPEACDNWASTKATYRFLDSDSFSTETIDEGFFQETVDRLGGHKIVLVAQDTTSINYNSHGKTKGLGYLGDGHSRGVLMHSALAISESGLPLGVIHRKLWVREDEEFGKRHERKKKPIEEKESYRWIETEESVEKRVPADSIMVMIGDRESDIYEYITRHRRNNSEMLIRLNHNRRLAEGAEHRLLFSRLDASPIQARAQLLITDHKTGKSRLADLSYRWETVMLGTPVSGKSSRKTSAAVNVIVVREENIPGGITGVEWKLMTTLAVSTFEDVQRIVRWYGYRWLIERFHFVLKSGCTIEKLQLEEVSRLERAIVLYMIVAWRLLYITYKARIEPESSGAEILCTYEWQALYCTVHKTRQPPAQPPTTTEIVLMIARLGGFLGRKGDGYPGVKVLWRGYKRLIDIAETYRLFVYQENENVGNG